jgi:hypothetical protein
MFEGISADDDRGRETGKREVSRFRIFPLLFSSRRRPVDLK